MKKKISNSDELNNYYNLVNKKLKKYSDMNIPSNRIAKYLKPGSINFNKFINDDDDLKDVDGIEIILKDIIEDTYAAFKDGLLKDIKKGMVKKFENYSLLENIFIINLSKEQEHTHERVLGDYFRISLSYIKLIDKALHIYAVNDDGVSKNIAIFSENEFIEIKENIIKEIINNIKVKNYIFTNYELNKKIPVKNFIDFDKIKDNLNEIISNEDVIKVISSSISSNIECKFLKIINLNSVEYYLFEVL